MRFHVFFLIHCKLIWLQRPSFQQTNGELKSIEVFASQKLKYSETSVTKEEVNSLVQSPEWTSTVSAQRLAISVSDGCARSSPCLVCVRAATDAGYNTSILPSCVWIPSTQQQPFAFTHLTALLQPGLGFDYRSLLVYYNIDSSSKLANKPTLTLVYSDVVDQSSGLNIVFNLILYILLIPYPKFPNFYKIS